MIYFYSLSSVFIVSLISFIGVLSLSFKQESLKKITLFLVSLSAGTLLGSTFFHLLPEAVSQKNGKDIIWIYIILGIIIFFILEKVVFWRHCHIPISKNHPHPLGIMNLVGDSLHNFIDGAIIAGSFLVSVPLGITTTVAVIVHEIPQEIGDYGVLIHAGYSRLKAVFLNFLIALTAMLGAILTIIIGDRLGNITEFLIPFTAGGFIYIATADLIPELKKEAAPLHSFLQLLTIILGLVIAYSLKLLE